MRLATIKGAAWIGAAMGMLMAGPAMAQEIAHGVWVTGPDKKGQIAHVNLHDCNGATCGTVLRSYDKNGARVVTPNIGKRVIWGMNAQSTGKYRGKVLVPAHRRVYNGTLDVSGNQLVVRGCLGPVCQSQTWQRLK